jgi:hypothetical protein
MPVLSQRDAQRAQHQRVYPIGYTLIGFTPWQHAQTLPGIGGGGRDHPPALTTVDAVMARAEPVALGSGGTIVAWVYLIRLRSIFYDVLMDCLRRGGRPWQPQASVSVRRRAHRCPPTRRTARAEYVTLCIAHHGGTHLLTALIDRDGCACPLGRCSARRQPSAPCRRETGGPVT